MKIVVAEDSVFIREILVLACREFGAEVVAEAQNGDEAISAVHLCKPDVLLLDLVLPHRNGVDVALELQKSHPQTRILAITSMEPEQIKDPIEFFGWISKPFTKQEIFHQLNRIKTREVAYG
ncbi:MAG: response regulator [Bdellovibrio sp.]